MFIGEGFGGSGDVHHVEEIVLRESVVLSLQSRIGSSWEMIGVPRSGPTSMAGYVTSSGGIVDVFAGWVATLLCTL